MLAASAPPAPGTAPFTALGAELRGIEACSLQNHHELVSSAPSFWFLLGCRQHLSLQPPGLPPVVEGDHVNPQLGRVPSRGVNPEARLP